MEVHDADGGNPRRGMREAVEFWEWRRIWYNAILIVIVALWIRIDLATFPSGDESERSGENVRPRSIGQSLLLRGLRGGTTHATGASAYFLAESSHRPFRRGNADSDRPLELLDRGRDLSGCAARSNRFGRENRSRRRGDGQQHELSSAAGGSWIPGRLRRIFRGDCGGRDLLVCAQSRALRAGLR